VTLLELWIATGAQASEDGIENVSPGGLP
jgi:hypothetical protein